MGKIVLRAIVFAAVILTITASIARAAESGFVRTSGRFLVDGNGQKLLLRGTNLGNWFVQEGYMFQLEHGPASAREIETMVNELIGPTEASRFWKQYRDTYISRQDIDFIAKQGFNAIRIPFHYRFFEAGNDEGFALMDRVISWAKADGLHVILDMHCAPGGQTGSNIDDGWGYPWLYEDPASQEQAAAIWKRIAEHYRNDKTVLGYDLLNEPISHYQKLRQYNPKLEPIYRKLVAAVRSADPNHVVILEAAQWDTNFTVFGPPSDRNAMYEFHKYWMKPVQSEIQEYIDFRDKYNVPIWMGESGENTDEWITTFRELLDQNEISWTFWPYKKMDATSSPVTFSKPAHWEEIVTYAARHGWMGDTEHSIEVRPSLEDCREAFADLLVNIRFDNEKVNPGYLKALGANPK